MELSEFGISNILVDNNDLHNGFGDYCGIEILLTCFLKIHSDPDLTTFLNSFNMVRSERLYI